MRYIKSIILILILQTAFAPFVFTQEDDEDVTKYTVKEYLEANLPPQEGRMIVLDEITGLLTITDTPGNQELALRLIREWDVRPKQISIEAKFVEITFTDLDEMGIDWQAYERDHPLIDFSTELMGDKSATAAATFTEAAELAGLGFFVGKATISGTRLLSYLKALKQSGKVNLLHAPRITTLSGQMANIQVIRSFPYATSAERTEVDMTDSTSDAVTGDIYPVETYEIEEEIVGIALEVTPTVKEGSDIVTLDIHPEVTKLSQQIAISSLTEIGDTTQSVFPTDLGWPIIDARSLQTTVMVRSGETIIMGGLIQDKDENTVERKIPFLGDIPFVGPLFRYKYEKREKKNLVIFLTARLIDTQGQDIR
jgi:type II secretory pathway component GspD/PulD (secretin)